MKCKEIHELMPDLAAGLKPVTAELKEHFAACPDCTGKLQEFRQTMALLDDWRAPEPSQYFDVRMRARLREEAAKPATGWLQWLRRPALAVSLAVLMAVGVTVVRVGERPATPGQVAVNEPVLPGTAVGDLQALDNNHDIYADFDLLDDLEVQQDVTANP